MINPNSEIINKVLDEADDMFDSIYDELTKHAVSILQTAKLEVNPENYDLVMELLTNKLQPIIKVERNNCDEPIDKNNS